MPSKLFGIADAHVHFLSDLASGGYMIWGKPFPASPATVGEAAERECLSHCDGEGGHGPAALFPPSLEGVGHLVGGFPEFDGWPNYSTMAHQQAFVEWIRRAYDGGLRLVVCLAGNSELLATRISELCGKKFGDRSIDDMSAIRRQVEGMKAMRDFIDQQSGGAGQGWMQIATTSEEARSIVAADRLCMIIGVEVASLGGWKSPEDLESKAALAGKLPGQLISEMVTELHDMGVRHFFPIHGTNNAFGGTALFVRNYDAANYLASGRSFEVERAPDELGISYRLDQDDFTGGAAAEVLGYHGRAAVIDILGSAAVGASLGGLIGGMVGAQIGGLIGGGVSVGRYACPPKPVNWSQPNPDRTKDTSVGGHINALGLTEHGEVLIKELGQRGALIDVDHMGEKTSDKVLSLCELAHYPVVSGHTSFRDIRFSNPDLTFNKALPPLTQLVFGTMNGRNLSREADKSTAQLTRIRNLGGFVAPILAQSDGKGCACARWTVANDSAGTSKSFAQAYLYAHHFMGGESVGMGSDIDGAGTLPGPRFGPNASPGLQSNADRIVSELKGISRRSQLSKQAYGVRYSTNPLEYRLTRFPNDASTLDGSPFDAEERDFWQAAVMEKSVARLETADWTGHGPLDGGRQYRIANFAAGLRGAGLDGGPLDYVASPAPGIFGSAPIQYSALSVSRNTPLPPAHASAEAKRLVAKLRPVWDHWQAMLNQSSTQNQNPHASGRLGPDGSKLYDSDGRLSRHTAGNNVRRRDFDLNMDGMAHYGMLPDFLQDLWNIGTSPEVMDTLYHSAHDFIAVWARCEANARNWGTVTTGLSTRSDEPELSLLLLQ